MALLLQPPTIEQQQICIYLNYILTVSYVQHFFQTHKGKFSSKERQLIHDWWIQDDFYYSSSFCKHFASLQNKNVSRIWQTEFYSQINNLSCSSTRKAAKYCFYRNARQGQTVWQDFIFCNDLNSTTRRTAHCNTGTLSQNILNWQQQEIMKWCWRSPNMISDDFFLFSPFYTSMNIWVKTKSQYHLL